MTATLTINTQLNGIEIKFDSKPITATLDSLKKLGFRWHNQKKLWYAKNTPERLELAQIITKTDNYAQQVKKEEPKKSKAEPVNKYGVKVGDVFESSWGYDQTNVSFFQVIALVGSSSVRVREVYLEILEETAVSGMSADRTYKLTKHLLPAASYSVFIEDQEKGDLKRLKSYAADGKSNPQFKLSSFANAYYCGGDTIQVYESWYA